MSSVFKLVTVAIDVGFYILKVLVDFNRYLCVVTKDTQPRILSFIVSRSHEIATWLPNSFHSPTDILLFCRNYPNKLKGSNNKYSFYQSTKEKSCNLSQNLQSLLSGEKETIYYVAASYRRQVQRPCQFISTDPWFTSLDIRKKKKTANSTIPCAFTE